MDPNPARQKYYLYNTELPNDDYFPYLDVPFKSGGIIDKQALIQQNINKTLGTMRQLLTLGAHKCVLDYFLSTRFYAQIVRPHLEYGFAITTFNLREIRFIDNCQNQCLRQIFGGWPFTSTKVMMYLANLLAKRSYLHIASLLSFSLLWFPSRCISNKTVTLSTNSTFFQMVSVTKAFSMAISL